MKTLFFHWLFIVPVAFATAGCDMISELIAEKVTEEVAEKVIETALEQDSNSNAEVDISAGKVEVKTDKGKMVYGESGVKIPENFPSDVVIPAKAKVRVAVQSDNMFNITAEIDVAPEELAKQVAADAGKNNWKQKNSMDLGHTKMLAYEKDGRSLSVSIIREEAKEGKQPPTILNIAAQQQP